MATKYDELAALIPQAQKFVDTPFVRDEDMYLVETAKLFASLGQLIVDLNARLARIEAATNKSLVDPHGRPIFTGQ